MGGVGWGMLTSCSWYVETLKKNMFQHVAAGCWRWNNNEQKKSDYQHVPFHANIKNIANTNKKTALHITPQAAVKTVLVRLKTTLPWNVLFRVGKQENQKLWNRTCCSRLMKLKQQRAKKRLTINMCRFMLTLKFTANTNKKRHLFILPHVPQ